MCSGSCPPPSYNIAAQSTTNRYGAVGSNLLTHQELGNCMLLSLLTLLFVYRFHFRQRHPKNLCYIYFWMAEPVWAGEGRPRRFERNNMSVSSFIRVGALPAAVITGKNPLLHIPSILSLAATWNRLWFLIWLLSGPPGHSKHSVGG